MGGNKSFFISYSTIGYSNGIFMQFNSTTVPVLQFKLIPANQGLDAMLWMSSPSLTNAYVYANDAFGRHGGRYHNENTNHQRPAL